MPTSYNTVPAEVPASPLPIQFPVVHSGKYQLVSEALRFLETQMSNLSLSLPLSPGPTTSLPTAWGRNKIFWEQTLLRRSANKAAVDWKYKSSHTAAVLKMSEAVRKSLAGREGQRQTSTVAEKGTAPWLARPGPPAAVLLPPSFLAYKVPPKYLQAARVLS